MWASPATGRDRSVFALVQRNRLTRHDRRDRMLVDKLALAIPAQQHAEVVEPGDHALQFDPVDEEDRDRNLRLADVVEECVLQVLFVGSHFYYAFVFLSRAGRVAASVGISMRKSGGDSTPKNSPLPHARQR
ncbi:hypothetical protein SDC9_25085 [bioreactor metagenome]|uniref:Uncharacterized protein n=1 Tax=bioreactor metagenome TaxID=1076179 RepID=A0A644UJX7_9ZZZZ